MMKIPDSFILVFMFVIALMSVPPISNVIDGYYDSRQAKTYTEVIDSDSDTPVISKEFCETYLRWEQRHGSGDVLDGRCDEFRVRGVE